MSPVFRLGEWHDGVHRAEIPLDPAKALREALVNAIVRRGDSIIGAAVMLEVLRDRALSTRRARTPTT